MTDSDRSNWTSLREEAEAAAAALPPLLVAAERLASSISLGVHGRRKAGAGDSFWQFRRYQSEDSAALIDWRQSAKSQHLYVREREWEVAEAVWFWCDGNATMRYGSGDTTKRDRAHMLALALASLLMRGGERIALYGAGQAPAAGRLALNRMAHALCTEQSGADAALPPEAPLGRNAQFVWFSDFLAPFGETETALRRIARDGLIGHLVRIVDPIEEEFPFTGRTRFEAVSGDASAIFGRAETVRDAYRRRFRAHGEALADLARRLGWSCLVHRTDNGPETALAALYVDMGGLHAQHALGQST